MQLSQLSNTLDPYNLDVVTVKDKEYRVYSYKGKITGFDDVLINICYEVAGSSFKAPFYILSTDLKLDATTIIEYYSKRWGIEVNYKYFKSNLGFDKYTVRSLQSIERYFAIEIFGY